MSHDSRSMKVYLKPWLGVLCLAIVCGCEKNNIPMPPENRDTPKSESNSGNSPNSSKLTKDSFREKLTSLRKDTKHGSYYPEKAVVQLLGKPSKTQTMGDLKYWYWNCQDGTIQVIINWYGDLGEDGKVFYVKEINDF